MHRRDTISMDFIGSSTALRPLHFRFEDSQEEEIDRGYLQSAISLAVMFGPLAQALVGPWITPRVTFALGVALSVSMALVAFLLLNNPRRRKRA